MLTNEEKIIVGDINFHPVLKDIENMFWFFILSVRTLSNPEIQNILRILNSSSEGYACFNQMLDKFNQVTGLKIDKNGNISTSKLNIYNEMVFIGKAMAILTYDFLSLSSYNAIINQDAEFQFLRHVRNGAAHNNKFNLKDGGDNWKIGEDEIICWKDKVISRKLQGQEVFNNFITMNGIFLLAKYFSERLTKIDDEKIK